MTRNEARKRAWTFKELKKTRRMMREEEGGMKGRRRRAGIVQNSAAPWQEFVYSNSQGRNII